MDFTMTQNTPLSRRALLAISAAAAAGTASGTTSGALAQAIAPNPDAPLLELCSQWEAHRLEYHRSSDELSDAEGAAVAKHRHLGMPALWAEVDRDPTYREAKKRVRDLVDRSHELFQTIGKMRAVTIEGIMAKARVTAGECMSDGGIEEDAAEYNDGVTPHYMALTLVRDLLAMHTAGEA